jgi:hypothetical protein
MYGNKDQKSSYYWGIIVVTVLKEAEGSLLECQKYSVS